MGRDEIGVGKESAPLAADLDEIGAVGAVTMKKNDELLWLAGTRLHPRTINRRHEPAPFRRINALLEGLCARRAAPAQRRAQLVVWN